MIRKLLSHSAIYGIAPQVTKFIGILALPILTKDLTALDYAVTGIMTSYTGMFSALQTLGLTIVISTSFYKYPNRYKYIWRQLLGFLTLYSIPFGLLLGAFFMLVIPKEVYEYRWEIVLLNVLPLVLFEPGQNFIFRYYQKMEKPVPLAVRTIITGLLTVVLNVYFISVLKMGFMGWFISYAIATALGFAFFIHPFFIKQRVTPIFNFKWRLIRNALKISLPTVPHYYSGYLLNSSDRVVMDVTKIPTAQIGLYSFAYNFGNYFQMAANALGNASSPMYYKAYRYKPPLEADQFARNLTWFKFLMLLTATFLFSIWSKEIFTLLVKNEALKATYPLAIIISMAYSQRPMYQGMFSKLAYHHQTKVFWKISFIAGVANIALNFIFIPLFGYQVAGITTFICLMYMGYSGYFIKEYKAHTHVNHHPVEALVGTIVLTIGAYFMVELSWMPKILISGVFVGALGLMYLKKKSFQLSIQ